MPILFLLYLIKYFGGPISKIACIPSFLLCIYKTGNIYYVQKNESDNVGREEPWLSCPTSKKIIEGNDNTYATMMIINVPRRYESIDDKKIKVFTPPNLRETIDKCIKDNKRFVICELALYSDSNLTEGHANVLIFDTDKKTIERFDPHGSSNFIDVKLEYDLFQISFYNEKMVNIFGMFNNEIIDDKLKKIFRDVLPEYNYIDINTTMPYLGPQVKADEYKGLCGTWSTMYITLRMLNPDMKSSDITKKMIDGTPDALTNRILRFQKFIINKLNSIKTNLKK